MIGAVHVQGRLHDRADWRDIDRVRLGNQKRD